MAAIVDGLYFALAIWCLIIRQKSQYDISIIRNFENNYTETFDEVLVHWPSSKVNFHECVGTDLILSLKEVLVDVGSSNDTQLSPNLKCQQRSPVSIHYRINTSSRNFLLLCIILSGDVHPDPGPNQSRKQKTPKNPCTVCSRGVVSRSKAIDCDECQKWTHVKCCHSITIDMYDKAVAQELQLNFVCNCCLAAKLPGFPDDDLDLNVSDNTQARSPDVDEPSPVNSEKKYECFKKKGLHFIHINARSLLNKLSELSIMASSSKSAIIAVSETWFDPSMTSAETSIDGYNLERRDRNRHGGGVCLYIRDDLTYNLRPDLCKPSQESIWVDILLQKTKPITVGCVYRPPDQSNFLDTFQDSLATVDLVNELYILGDFNIDISRSSSLSGKYNNVLKLFGLSQLINEPTRITDHSQSLIDHIVTNQSEKICQHGCIEFGFSDHVATFCTRKIVRGLFSGHKSVKLRSLKNYDQGTYLDLLKECNWNEVLECDDVSVALRAFNRTMLSVIDTVAPVKEVRVKSKTEPWINSEILEAIEYRNKLLKNLKHDKCNLDLKNQFCKARNKVQRLVCETKKSYFFNKISEDKNNPKKLWSHFQKLGYSSKSKGKNHIILEIDGEICYDSLTVGNYVNEFFTTVAEKLTEKLPHPSGQFSTMSSTFKNYYSGKVNRSTPLTITNVDVSEVLKELKALNPCKSTGLDNIPSKFLREGAEVISVPLTHIINLSIRNKQVPAEWKEAKITPLFKKNNRLQVGNYRPVSILNVSSKILEKCVYKQVEDYLTSNNLIYEYQSGFRTGFSTDTCLIYIQDYIRQNMDLGHFTGMALLDVQKAFDSVDHKILTEKLEIIGIDSDWFRSYLDNRQQVVDINGTISGKCTVTCGVPQGSLLGPLLFLIYSNDMKCAVSSKLLLYADDSVLLVSDKDPDLVAQKLSDEMNNCYNWMVDNKLSMHAGKTELILFGSKSKLRKIPKFEISFQDHKISSQNSVKYLGSFLDNDLSGKSMSEHIIKKASSRIKFLFRNQKFLDLKCRKLLGSALVQCHLDYSISSWFNGIGLLLQRKLQVVQNRLIRFILNKHARYHLYQTDLDKIGFLKVSDRATQLALNHMYKIKNNASPPYLYELFNPVSNRHQYNTRFSQESYAIGSVGPFTKSSFSYNATKDWNALPLPVKMVTSLDHFKAKVKKFLSEKQRQSETSEFHYY